MTTVLHDESPTVDVESPALPATLRLHAIKETCNGVASSVELWVEVERDDGATKAGAFFDAGRVLDAVLKAMSSVAVVALLLTGCANAPPPTPATSHAAPSDPLADALGRIGSRTAQQATGMGGSAASREVITTTGGSFGGQVLSAGVRNTASEVQRWWSGR